MARMMKRKRSTKKTFKKRKVSKSVKSYVRRTLATGEEHKFAVYGSTFAPVIATPVIYATNVISRGVERFARIGNKIRMTKLDAFFQLRSTVATQPQVIRILMFLDRQPQGALPTVADVFTNTAQSWNSPLNPIQVGPRLRLLSDKYHYLQINGGATDVVQVKQVRIRKRWPKLGQVVKFTDGNAGTIADIAQFSLLIVCCNQSANAAGIDYQGMLTYTDS